MSLAFALYFNCGLFIAGVWYGETDKRNREQFDLLLLTLGIGVLLGPLCCLGDWALRHWRAWKKGPSP